MVEIFSLDQIKDALKGLNPIQAIEEGFIAYSQGKTVIPPVGELVFKEPPGDMHIKYGYIIGAEYAVIKIATGFYENYKLNLPNYEGLMLIFSQKTGYLLCILLDKAHLTHIRTAAAGTVTAKYLAPKKVRKIGIFGAGTQGRLQLEYLRSVTPCQEVYVWGINSQEIDVYKQDMESKGYSVKGTLEAEEIAANCNLIVTATPAKKPLLQAGQIRPGTHITAMGSDTPEKNELDPKILGKADLVVTDSLSQCQLRGEISKALEAGTIKMEQVHELGNIILIPELHRSTDEQITIADLTGVAIQDIQISVAVYEKLTGRKK
jgi:ornithine cyclodeaminase